MPQAAPARRETAPPLPQASRPAPASRAPDPSDRENCSLARDIASAAFDVPIEDMGRPSRSDAATCNARHCAMYLAHVAFQVPLTAVAQDFGRDRTGVAYAVRRIEERRDDAHFDARMARLERLAAAFRGVIADMGCGTGAN